MSFDFSTLVTDRTQQDVAYVKQLVEKLVTGTATDKEKAEWNSFTLKGAYNHTDLNRVTEAMRYLVFKLRSYGYAVNFSEIALPRKGSFYDVQLKPVSVESGTEYDSYSFEALGTGAFLCSVISGVLSDSASVEVLEDKEYMVDLSKPKLWLYNKGDECVSVTGGWESIGLGWESAYDTSTPPVITRNSDNMTLTQVTITSQYYNCGMVKTKNKIPIATAKKVHFSVYAYSEGAGEIIRLKVAKSIGTHVVTTEGSYKNILAYEHGPVEGVYTLDVSSINEDCYIGIAMYQESTVIVDRIWIE